MSAASDLHRRADLSVRAQWRAVFSGSWNPILAAADQACERRQPGGLRWTGIGAWPPTDIGS